MFISLKYKLFATLLAAVLVVVVAMLTLVHRSFDRGFLNYINTVELKRLDSLVNDLQAAYADQGEWTFLKENPRLWRQFLAASTPEGPQFDPLENGIFTNEPGNRRHQPGMSRGMRQRRNPRHNFGPGMKHRFGFRVVLMDAEKNVVIGPRKLPANIKTIPLTHESVTVGFLGHIPRDDALARHQEQFVQQQKKAFIIISLVIAVLATLISFPLATRLVRRINALAKGTHSLAAGKYNTRLEKGPADELGQLIRDFNSLALTLEKNEQSRKQWVADISHELRTPLAVLRGELEALQDGVHQFTPESIHSLHIEVMRLNRLVDDLFQLSMSDIGALTYKKKQVNVIVSLNHSVDLFRSEFAKKNITLKVSVPPSEELCLFADPERLLQLFDNLLSNSLNYTEKDGELQVSCIGTGTGVEILFQDSGPGVPAADIDRMFERLFRVEGSRSRASGGAGLGLAICRNIVEAHGGIISAEPSPLGGVLIKITLPAGDTS